MLARTTRIRIALLTLVFLSLAAFSTAQRDKDKEPAPRFHAKTIDGESFTNDSTKGKAVLFEFWTTWCPYCAGEATIVDNLGKEFADKGLIVLAVDVGESKKTVKRYLDTHPRNCRIVYMEDTNLAAMYAATVYPIYVVVDRDGDIVGTQRGAAGERALRRLLARAGISSPDEDAASASFSSSGRRANLKMSVFSVAD
jgi:thiol-disulfide isomerase/thioredoxin